MLFNSFPFICLFFPISLVGYFLLGKFYRKESALVWLVLCSLFFYGWWNINFVPLLVGTMVFNFYLGTALSRGTRFAKTVLVFGVAADLLLLAYFKYMNFFIDNLNVVLNTHYSWEKIVLPLGISFYTFQQIAYRVEAYNGKRKNDTFLNYCVCVTFFPHLIAGPIVRYSALMPQFQNSESFRFNAKNISIGLTIFVTGLAKKVLIADVCGGKANSVFASVNTGIIPGIPEAWLGVLAFTFQLYFDFSGYSDMALGIAKTFNIDLPVNFDSPYKATSIAEFWTRSHISLSHFIRDHLYQPLARAKKKPGRIWLYSCVFVSMTIMGVWHGAGWTFVVYGLVHATYQVGNFIYRHQTFPRMAKVVSPLVLQIRNECYWALTFVLLVAALVLFRSETLKSASIIFQGMIGLGGPWISLSYMTTLKLLGIIGFLKWAPNIYDVIGPHNFTFGRDRQAVVIPVWLHWRAQGGVAFGVAVLSVYILYCFFDGSGNEFVYFQF